MSPQSFTICRTFTNFMVSKRSIILHGMTKIAIKYDNIVPYSRFFM